MLCLVVRTGRREPGLVEALSLGRKTELKSGAGEGVGSWALLGVGAGGVGTPGVRPEVLGVGEGGALQDTVSPNCKWAQVGTAPEGGGGGSGF